jgi:hypothetical protein
MPVPEAGFSSQDQVRCLRNRLKNGDRPRRPLAGGVDANPDIVRLGTAKPIPIFQQLLDVIAVSPGGPALLGRRPDGNRGIFFLIDAKKLVTQGTFLRELEPS